MSSKPGSVIQIMDPRGTGILSHKQILLADLIIDKDGRILKDRSGIVSRRATDQELREAEQISP